MVMLSSRHIFILTTTTIIFNEQLKFVSMLVLYKSLKIVVYCSCVNRIVSMSYAKKVDMPMEAAKMS